MPLFGRLIADTGVRELPVGHSPPSTAYAPYFEGHRIVFIVDDAAVFSFFTLNWRLLSDRSALFR